MAGSAASTLAIGWERLHQDARQLARTLLDMQERFEGIVAVSRGGLVPAAILAREMDLRLVDTICIASYREREQGRMAVLKMPSLVLPQGAGSPAGKGLLVVDDLSDTGRTADAVRESLPGAHIATLYVKPRGRDAVDSYVAEMPQECWFLFPWDCALQEVAPLVGGGQAQPAGAPGR